jgi:hypothetical protein
MLVLVGFEAALQAQEKLPPELIAANAALDGAQQRKLDDYANYWIQNMLSSTDAQVSDARDKLVSPMRHPSAGSVFKSAYSATLIRLLPQLLANNRMLVRFNAMLCVSSLEDKSAIDMIQAGLADNNPAIRYLAAQAAGKMGKKLDPSDQMRILTLLQASFIQEPDQVVVEQLLNGMSQLTVPQARLAMLEALNMHVDVHDSNTNITLKSDSDAMQSLLRDLVTEQTNGVKIPFQVTKQYAVAACRFMVHCATALEQNLVHPTMVAQYTKMIEDCEKTLRWICTRPMGMEDKNLPQDDMRPNMQAKQWLAVRLRAEEWRKTLQDPPFNTSQRDLAVPRK